MPYMRSPSGSPTTPQAPWRPNGGPTSPPPPPPPPPAVPERRLMPPPSIVYIPPLIDGACGTTPNFSRRSTPLGQLRDELSRAAHLLPQLLHGAAVSSRTLGAVEAIQHVALALVEAAMLASAVPLWLALPGALFAAWLAGCAALVWAMAWFLNGGGARGDRVVRSPSPAAAQGWMMGQENDDEQWFFAAGLGTSSRSLAKSTLPALAKLFSRNITAVHAPTYGLPIDLLLALVQRALPDAAVPFPSSSSSSQAVLYNLVRTALLDPKNNRTVLLAHNTGAIAVARCLRRLYADVPTDRMAKLEIYTFGAAAADFTTPLGGLPGGSDLPPTLRRSSSSSGSLGGSQQQIHQQQIHHQHSPEFVAERRGPHIEHFAFANDPLARMGVLRSVREDLEGRFCGSVFVMHCPGAAHHGPHSDSPSARATRDEEEKKKTAAGEKAAEETSVTTTTTTTTTFIKVKPLRRPLMSLNDYLSCLFPDQSGQSYGSAMRLGGQQHQHQHQAPRHRSILDGLMSLDRDLAEKREFAALAKDAASHQAGKGEKKRLSWTRLGATAGGLTGNMDGIIGLEMARKGCRDCAGHRGREVSWLVRYVCIPSQFGLDNRQGS